MFTRTFRRLRDQSSVLLARPNETLAPQAPVGAVPLEQAPSHLEARLLGSFELTVVFSFV
jgi:hypothetical protein